MLQYCRGIVSNDMTYFETFYNNIHSSPVAEPAPFLGIAQENRGKEIEIQNIDTEVNFFFFFS